MCSEARAALSSFVSYVKSRAIPLVFNAMVSSRYLKYGLFFCIFLKFKKQLLP